MTTTIGSIKLIATIDTSSYKKGEGEIDSSNKRIEDSASSVERKSNSSFSKIAKVGIGGLIAATAVAAAAIVKNIGGAINRIDTLVAFPRVLKALGVSSDDAESATEKLSKSLQGLPTSLQDGAKGVQNLVSSGLGVNKATDAYLAMNNALLAAGGDAADTGIVMDSLSRAISAGEVDAKTMQATLSRMPTVLSALSKETGKSSGELFKLYSNDPQKLIDDMIRLNKEGSGSMASLDKQAREATGGIATAFDNLDNAVTRGIEGIVKVIGGGDLATGQKKISDGITAIGKALGSALLGFGTFIAFVAEKGGQFSEWVTENKTLITNLGIVITTVLLPKIVAIGIQSTIAFAKFVAGATVAGVQALIAGGKMAAAWLLALGPIGLIVSAVVGATALIIANWDTVSKFVSKVWGNITKWASNTWKSITKIFSRIGGWFSARFGEAWQGVKNAFSGARTFFSGVWKTITSIFRSIGTAIGNAVGGAFKGVVNGVLTFIENTVNGIVTSINNIVDAIDKAVPGDQSGFKLSKLSIPKLAEGGIVSNATLAVVGEGSEPEAVIPLSKLDAMMNNKDQSKPSQNTQVVVKLSHNPTLLRQAALDTIELVNQVYRAKGMQEIGVS